MIAPLRGNDCPPLQWRGRAPDILVSGDFETGRLGVRFFNRRGRSFSKCVERLGEQPCGFAIHHDKAVMQRPCWCKPRRDGPDLPLSFSPTED